MPVSLLPFFLFSPHAQATADAAFLNIPVVLAASEVSLVQ